MTSCLKIIQGWGQMIPLPVRRSVMMSCKRAQTSRREETRHDVFSENKHQRSDK
jgi:hypothetical protein